jgi:hypothetical protein
MKFKIMIATKPVNRQQKPVDSASTRKAAARGVNVLLIRAAI